MRAKSLFKVSHVNAAPAYPEPGEVCVVWDEDNKPEDAHVRVHKLNGKFYSVGMVIGSDTQRWEYWQPLGVIVERSDNV